MGGVTVNGMSGQESIPHDHDKDMREGEAGVMWICGEELSGRWEQQVQRPWDRSLSDVFQEQREGLVARGDCLQVVSLVFPHSSSSMENSICPGQKNHNHKYPSHE